MEKTNHINSCDSRVRAYKNGKTMEQCKEEARENTRVLSKKLLENGEVSWTRVLDTAGHDRNNQILYYTGYKLATRIGYLQQVELLDLISYFLHSYMGLNESSTFISSCFNFRGTR